MTNKYGNINNNNQNRNTDNNGDNNESKVFNDILKTLIVIMEELVIITMITVIKLT